VLYFFDVVNIFTIEQFDNILFDINYNNSSFLFLINKNELILQGLIGAYTSLQPFFRLFCERCVENV
jgi:hypothetical protein